MNIGTLGTLGGILSITVTIAVFVGGLIAARVRRVARRNTELEELRDLHLAAMGYIFDLERASQELCKRTGFELNIEKPAVLQRSYLKKKAEQDGNKAIEEITSFMSDLQGQMHGAGIRLPGQPGPQPPPAPPASPRG